MHGTRHRAYDSMQQFMEQAMAEGQMSGGQPLPNDPTKPVNPFGSYKQRDQFYLTDRWQRMVVSWVWMEENNMV